MQSRKRKALKRILKGAIQRVRWEEECQVDLMLEFGVIPAPAPRWYRRANRTGRIR